MAYFGGQMQTQAPPTGWCDYCQQKPKFPPYNYCGKACGARAKATGSVPSNAPVMCKQCGQKPVYKNHQFCGRNCANTWQAMYGQTNAGGRGQPQHGQQSWNPIPPPYTQNPPNNPVHPLQGFGQSGGIVGFVKGIKDLVSPSQQPQPQPQFQPQFQPQPPQPQPGQYNPSYTRQVPGQTSPSPMMVSPPITPMSSGGSLMSLGMGGPMQLGTFDPMSPRTPTPTSPGLNEQYYSPSSPTGPGIQDPNANSQINGQYFSSPSLPVPHISKQNSTPGQKSKTMSMAMNPQKNTTGGGGIKSSYDDPRAHADPDQDPTATSNSNQFTGGPAPVQGQAPAQFTIQVTSIPTGAGGHGNGKPSCLPSQQSTSTSTTCRLKGCKKPVSVDHQNEYCSQRHREDAKIFGQVNPCIMCREMPRSRTDHFCSEECRGKALSP